MDTTHSTFKEATERAKSLAAEGKSVSLKRDGDAWVVSVEGLSEEPVEAVAKNSIWVGKFEDTGAIVVFDRAIEVEGIRNYYGYIPARNLMRQFRSDQKDAANPVSGKENDDAICKYMAWKKQHASMFIESEIERLESKRQEAIQKHKETVTKMGKPYSGVNLKTAKVHRVAGCYSCKTELDSDINVECNECGWLLCECGACGCGYE